MDSVVDLNAEPRLSRNSWKFRQTSPEIVSALIQSCDQNLCKNDCKILWIFKIKEWGFLRKSSTRGRHETQQNLTKLATKLSEQADKSPPGDQTSGLELGGGSGRRVSGCGWRPRRFGLWSLPSPRDLQKFRHQKKLQTCRRTSFFGADKLQPPDRGSASPLDYTKPDYFYILSLLSPSRGYAHFNAYSQNQPFIAQTFT